MVTKNDAKNFLTKDDAENFATKDDLKNFVTNDSFKNELKKYAAQDTVDRIARKLLEHDDEFKRIKETMATKDDIRLILDRIDAFTQKNETVERRMDFHDHRFNETAEKIADHEKRITALEKTA